MGDMGKEGSNLLLRSDGGSVLAKLRIRPQGVQERLPPIEALARARARGLIDNAVEELLGDKIGDRAATTGGRRRVTWPPSAALTAVRVAGSAVAILAAAEVRRAPTILGSGGDYAGK